MATTAAVAAGQQVQQAQQAAATAAAQAQQAQLNQSQQSQMGLNGTGTGSGSGGIRISKPDQEFNPYEEELAGQSRDISQQAVWTLSSCKVNFGVENLIDNNLETFWQSDGPQPHLVNMQFKMKTKVKDICIYADYKSDESYTPSRIVIKAGTHVNDLREIGAYDLLEPAGWIIIPLRDPKHINNSASGSNINSNSSVNDESMSSTTNDNNNDNSNKRGSGGSRSQPIKTWMLQLAVLANHQNGRDTHIRQIKIHSPIETTSVILQPKFSTVEIGEWSTVR